MQKRIELHSLECRGSPKSTTAKLEELLRAGWTFLTAVSGEKPYIIVSREVDYDLEAANKYRKEIGLEEKDY